MLPPTPPCAAYCILMVFVCLYGMDRRIRQRMHPPTELVVTSAVVLVRSLVLRVLFCHLLHPNWIIILHRRLVQNRFEMSFNFTANAKWVHSAHWLWVWTPFEPKLASKLFLGASRAALGRRLGPTWEHLGSVLVRFSRQNGQIFTPKWNQDGI